MHQPTTTSSTQAADLTAEISSRETALQHLLIKQAYMEGHRAALEELIGLLSRHGSNPDAWGDRHERTDQWERRAARHADQAMQRLGGAR